MVFPGVLRGLPGPRLATTPTNRPRRSLSSPGMFLRSQCSRAARFNESDAVPGPLRGTRPSGPRAFGLGGAASHLSGLALWRLGTASSSKVRLSRGDCKPYFRSSPHPPRKWLADTPKQARRHPKQARRHPKQASRHPLRRRLALVPQWRGHGRAAHHSPLPDAWPLPLPRARRRHPRQRDARRRDGDGHRPGASHRRWPARRGQARGTALRRRAPRAAQAHRQRPRRHRRRRGQVRHRAEGAARRAAQRQDLPHRRHRAHLRRRLQPLLGLDLRGRLRRLDLHPRDGPRDRAAPRGHQGQRTDVHPLHGRAHHIAVAR